MIAPDIAAEIRRVAADFAKVSPEALDPHADLRNQLGIDSLEALKLLAQLEKRYGILIPDHLLGELNTLDRLVIFVSRQVR